MILTGTASSLGALLLEPSRQLGPSGPSSGPPGRPWPVAGLLWASRLHISRRTSFAGQQAPDGPGAAWTLGHPQGHCPAPASDLLGPHKATSPGNPIPLGAFGGCLGPQGQVRDSPTEALVRPKSPRPWPRGLGDGGAGLTKAPLHPLSTCWGSRTPAHGSTGGVGEGHAEPRQGRPAGLPWQRWQGSHHQPPAARGFHSGRKLQRSGGMDHLRGTPRERH